MRLPMTAAILLALAAQGCGGGAELPQGYPTVPPPPARPDGGAHFLAQCAAAGCTDRCEPLGDGGVACGVVCGERCPTLCATSRCETASGWVDAYCTNASGAAASWSTEPRCDDGNACTAGDACAAGRCTGAPEPTTVACDDGDACTGGDHCDGQGGCAGNKITADPVHRFHNPVAPFNFGTGAPGFYTPFGYADDGTIFYSSAAGDIDLYELHDAASDRLVSSAPTEGGYGFGAFTGSAATDTRLLGRGFASAVPGTVELLRYAVPTSQHCTNDARCHFFTTNAGDAPAGATPEASGIFVCPP